jgi:hypothetical protein
LKSCLTILTATLLSGTAMAQDSGSAGGPPPEVLSQINLGNAGLLPLVYSDTQYGLTQTRNGESRARIGAAELPTGAKSGYEHESITGVAPITLRYHIPDTTSYLTLKGTGNRKVEADSLTQANQTLWNVFIGYQDFYSPTAMYGISVGYGEIDSEGAASRIQRETFDFRIDYANKFSDHWGFVGRAVYANGDTSALIKRPGISYSQPDDHVYLQGELVGHYTNEDMGLVPDGWAFRPVLGISAQRFFLDDVTNNLGGLEEGGTETVGSVWGRANLVKMAPPGSLSPSLSVGLEHVYTDTNDAFIDEDTYAIFGAGLSFQTQDGLNLSLTYDRRQGLNGQREYNGLVFAANISF